MDVTFPGDDGVLRGSLSVPGTTDPAPGVVVLHEAFGLTDDIREIADRFASHGYVALAPDLFSWGLTVRCVVSAFRAMLSGKGRAFDDIERARGWLADRPECTGTVGVIGFCMGGGFALLCAPRGTFAASSVNYGLVPKDADRVLAGACPIVASFGGRDRAAKGSAARLETALTVLSIDHDVKEYPDASHSFWNHHDGWKAVVDRIGGFGYHEASAEDAWERTLRFFDGQLRSGA